MVWNKFWKEKTGDPFLICNHYAECVKDYKENIITSKFGQIDRPLGTDGGIHNVRKKSVKTWIDFLTVKRKALHIKQLMVAKKENQLWLMP